MQLLNLTLPTAAENVALEEALLESAESNSDHPEVLRFWEHQSRFVVLGRGSPWAKEVNHQYCFENNIPILRRCSGGATVVGGKGCLMYSLLLDYRKRPELRMLDVAHREVMSKLMAAITDLGFEISMDGTCDLIYKERKFSGNALRCKRNFMLYHGTILTSLPVDQIASCLAMPTRQPDYRKNRSHLDFIGLLPADHEEIRDAVARHWEAKHRFESWPEQLTKKLVEEKYKTDDWTKRV